MKLLGKLKEDEKKEIEEIYYRKVALENMLLVLQGRGNVKEDGNEGLYQKLVQDMSETVKKMGLWWDKTSRNYGWEYSKENSWEVKFETGDVYLHS